LPPSLALSWFGPSWTQRRFLIAYFLLLPLFLEIKINKNNRERTSRLLVGLIYEAGSHCNPKGEDLRKPRVYLVVHRTLAKRARVSPKLRPPLVCSFA
jgi:hypothetical protein